MTDPTERSRLQALLADLDEEQVLAQVRQRLDAGDDALAIVEDCNAGMRLVGERYEQGEYFVSALIMSGEIFREVVELVQPHLARRVTDGTTGVVLLGTVRGDIHDIGKNMAAMLLECHGFRVVDLGVDVPAEEFAAPDRPVRPDHGLV
jgi:methanogenic corrinoid protein MtbC1